MIKNLEELTLGIRYCTGDFSNLYTDLKEFKNLTRLDINNPVES